MAVMTGNQYFESEDFQFYAAPFTVQSPIEQHAHEFFEVVIVAEGHGMHLLPDDSHPIARGDVLIIKPGDEHAYIVDSGKSLQVYNVLFQRPLLQTLSQSCTGLDSIQDIFSRLGFSQPRGILSMTLQTNEQWEVLHLMDRIVHEYEQKKIGYQLIIKTKLIELFVFLLRSYEMAKQRPLVSQQDERQLFREVCNLIKRNFSETITMNQICRLCSMSPSTFSHKFKKHTGKTLVAYRNQIRIEQAAILLTETNNKIIDIAHRSGFEDVSHFNRMFKRYTNVSPGKYRKGVK